MLCRDIDRYNKITTKTKKKAFLNSFPLGHLSEVKKFFQSVSKEVQDGKKCGGDTPAKSDTVEPSSYYNRSVKSKRMVDAYTVGKNVTTNFYEFLVKSAEAAAAGDANNVPQDLDQPTYNKADVVDQTPSTMFANFLADKMPYWKNVGDEINSKNVQLPLVPEVSPAVYAHSSSVHIQLTTAFSLHFPPIQHIANCLRKPVYPFRECVSGKLCAGFDFLNGGCTLMAFVFPEEYKLIIKTGKSNPLNSFPPQFCVLCVVCCIFFYCSVRFFF